MIFEHLHGFGVNVDDAGLAALGSFLDALSRDDDGRARDVYLPEVEVDVPPPEIEQFAAPGAGVCGEAVEGEQPMPLGGIEERPELAGRPHLPRLGASLAWPLGALDRIGCQDLVNDAWTYSMVRGDRPVPFRPPLLARSR